MRGLSFLEQFRGQSKHCGGDLWFGGILYDSKNGFGVG